MKYIEVHGAVDGTKILISTKHIIAVSYDDEKDCTLIHLEPTNLGGLMVKEDYEKVKSLIDATKEEANNDTDKNADQTGKRLPNVMRGSRRLKKKKQMKKGTINEQSRFLD